MVESLRVLHVDDDPDFAEMAAVFLKREDERFLIETMTDPTEAVEALGTDEFNCIVSDYDMPHMNGLRFLETVREKHSDLPFILFTGKGSEEVASDAISAGATDYLQKGGGSDRFELLANRIQNAVEQYHSKQRRKTLERIRAIVNNVNQALVRASSRQQIEQQVCDILADAEPYRFAVVAEVDPETKQIHPSTWAGKGEGFLDEFKMSVAEDALGRQAPGGRAFKDREVAIAQDIQSDPAYEYWRDLALKHGFQSIAVVPLDYDGDLYGLLAVFANRPHAFDEAQQEVLEELGDDIAHAVASLRVRDDLHNEKERFRLLAESATDAIVTINAESTIQFANSAVEDIFGYQPDELVGEPLTMLIPETYRERHREAVTQFLETGEPTLDWSNIEFPGMRKDGQEIDLSITFAEFEQGGDQYFEAIIRDITDRKTRQRKLERYETIARTVQDGICVVNRDSEFTMVNDAFIELTGYSRDELLGSHVSLVRPKDLDQTFEELQSSLETGSQVESIEMEIERSDGSRRVIDARYGRFSHNGESGRVGAWRDITEQKEREQALERYQEYTERMLDAIDDLFFVHDTDGNLLRWNKAFSEVTGYSDEEIASMNGSDFVPREHRERAAAAIERVFETGHARLEAPLLTRSGETIPYEYAADRVENPDGDPRLVGVGRDISERKQREQELRESERRYRTLAENFPNGGVFLLDRDLRFQLVSGAGFDPIETSPDDLIGNTIDEVEPFSAEVSDTLESVHTRALEGERVTTELTYEGHVYLLQAVPVRDHEGAVMQVLAITQDITERKEQERELKRQNDRLQQLTRIIGHDLRNPLNVVEGRLELAQADCNSEHLDQAATALDRSLTLVNDLLTLAREGSSVGEFESVDLGELVEYCWQNVLTAEATLIVDVDTDRVVRADRSRLEQLLENLIRNAVDHGGEDVTVYLDDLEDGFYVADDGPGIPEDDRKQVFESGYSTAEEGTGFGLSIVAEIVHAHGWNIAVTESETGGARFEITDVEFV